MGLHRARRSWRGRVAIGAVVASILLTGYEAGTAHAQVADPTARDDSYSAVVNRTLHVAAPGVLRNDTDTSGGALTATLLTSPAHGTVTLRADGSFDYAPTTNYTGPDQFSYNACRAIVPTIISRQAVEGDGCDPANVFINVGGGVTTTPVPVPVPVPTPGARLTCSDLLNLQGLVDIPRVSIWYRAYLDTDNDGIACESTDGTPLGRRLTCAQVAARTALPVPSNNPWYRSYLDGNHNGWACETDETRPPTVINNNTTVNNPPPAPTTVVTPSAPTTIVQQPAPTVIQQPGPSEVFVTPPPQQGFSQIQQVPNTSQGVWTGDGSLADIVAG